MVCSFAGGQMTTTSQIMSENVGSWKLAAQYIQRELKEADEVNLLDEEDMHVFGLRPMMDPLILVCCNSCKKPVKNSQYATHAEICRSSNSLVDSTTETDAVAVQKKLPRKERKKLQNNTSTQVAPGGKPQRCTLANAAASNFHANEQSLKATSFPTQPKGRKFLNKTREKSVKNFDSVTRHQTSTKLNDLQTKDKLSVPAPLATKIFYSQRTQRLRSAINNMYCRTSYTQLDDGLCNMQFSDSNNMPSTNGNFHHNQIDDQLDKIGKHVPCVVENTDPVPSKSSEADSDETRKFLPLNFPDQFYVNNALGPKRTMVSLASDILPAPLPSDEY